MKHKRICIIFPLMASLVACNGYQSIYHADAYEANCASVPLKLKSDMSLSTVKPTAKNKQPVDLDDYITPEIWKHNQS